MRGFAGGLILVATLGCNQKTSLSPGCAADQSASACDRCQARRCAAQLDQCYGPELREGSQIPGNAAACAYDGSAGDVAQAVTTYYSNDPRLQSCAGSGVVFVRCQWDEATHSYTRDCVYGGGGADGGVSFAGACRDFSRCVQSCGCLTDCSPSCARAATQGCTLCQTQILQPCVTRMCAEECGGADAGR
jgi:hypothetical protein